MTTMRSIMPGLLCVLMCLSACEDPSPRGKAPTTLVADARQNLDRDLASLKAAMQAGDMSAFVSLMPSDVLRLGGGASKLAAQMSSSPDTAATFKSTVVDPPGEIVVTKDGAAAVVTYAAGVYDGGKRLGKMFSGMLAISDDGGATWRFIDVGADATTVYLATERPMLYDRIASDLPKLRVVEDQKRESLLDVFEGF